MRMFLDENLLKTLTTKVLLHFGKKNLLPADCRVLSADIFSKTEKTISETTLKRLFGFAKRSFDFSIYTLDTLAIYLDYENWNSFYELNATTDNRQLNGSNKWQDLKLLCTKHSLFTLQAVKSGTGIEFSKTIERTRLTAFVKKFLATNTSILPLVAPAGSGKSVGLAHTALKLWLSKEAMLPQDICCFINIHQIQTVATYKHSLFEWFNKYLGFQYQDIHLLDAERKADDKLVIIIDGFDERAFSSDKLKLIYANIAEFIQFNNACDWVKIILSLRPTIWSKLMQAYFNPSFFLNRVFIDESFPQENYRNHTLPFSYQEMEQILQLHNQPKSDTCCYSQEFLEFISIPRYLDILCTLLAENHQGRWSEEQLRFKITELDIKHYFLFDTHTAVKARIIEKLVEYRLTPYLPGNTDLKEWIMVKDALTATSYCQLVDDFLLTEEKEFAGSIFRAPKVSFTNTFLETYFISWFSLKQNEYTVSRHMINAMYVNEEFTYNKQTIIKWYLIYSIQTANFNAVEEIFQANKIGAEEQYGYFEFLLEMMEPEKHSSAILSSLEKSNRFIHTFFEKSLYYQCIEQNKEKVLLSFFKISEEKIHRQSFLCLLFINAVMQLKIQHAEVYLREYRQASKNQSDPAIAIQEKLMEYVLDFARYDFKTEDMQQLISRLQQCIASAQPETIHPIYLSILLLTHTLLYTGDHERLLNATDTLQKSLEQVETAGKHPLKKTLRLLQFYAVLMQTGVQQQTEEAILQLINNPSSTTEPVILLNALGSLVLARLYEKKKVSELAIRYANQVYNTCSNNCLKIYKLLSYSILKETYRTENQQEKVQEANEKIKELFISKHDEKINYDLKDTLVFHSKKKFL